jgi:DNA-binding NarL/FixJ family response regulator
LEFPEWKVRYCLERVGGEEGVRRLRELYESGVPVRRIMEELGLGSPECIYALVGKRRRGGYSRRGRVTPEVEAEVVRLRREGLTVTEIAGKVGLSVGSVHRILKKHGLTGRVKK